VARRLAKPYKDDSSLTGFHDEDASGEVRVFLIIVDVARQVVMGCLVGYANLPW
jgi:hypothetical protein